MQSAALFGITTDDVLPEAYLTSYKAWDGYMAEVWHGLLSHLAILKDSTIIEIGAGSSLKIGLALAKLHFKGTVYLVDPCKDILEKTAERYANLLPSAKIFPLYNTLAASLGDLPRSPELIASNHPLDDMILLAGLSGEQSRELFGWATAPSDHLSAALKERWMILSKEKAALASATETTFKHWQDAFQTLNPRLLALSQYSSSALMQDPSLDSLNTAAKQVLYQLKDTCKPLLITDDALQTQLNIHKNYNNHYIGTEVLDARNWMIYRSND